MNNLFFQVDKVRIYLKLLVKTLSIKQFLAFARSCYIVHGPSIAEVTNMQAACSP